VVEWRPAIAARPTFVSQKEHFMPKNTPKNTKKRTQVKDLSKGKKKLTKDEAKKIKGGSIPTESVSLAYGKIKF